MPRATDLATAPLRALDALSDQMAFYVQAVRWVPRTLRRYTKEVLRLLAEVSLGTGALSVIGGTVGVLAFLAFFTGSQVGLQGYSSLDQLGTGAFAGFQADLRVTHLGDKSASPYYYWQGRYSWRD